MTICYNHRMIVITGASDGVGLQLAKLYKAPGKKVINISRRECKYADENILLSLREGPEIVKASSLVEAIPDKIEAIVNCIGVYNEQIFGEITEDEVKRLMSTNVKAPLLLISMLIERIKKDEADVLNVISTAGTRGQKENPLYATSKWAERGFTLSLQNELKDTKCRVISFCPGGISTKLFEKAVSNDNRSENWMPPEDIALFIKQILELPKTMEVSEVIINRN
jgi:short-subunit dehydrogenase